MKILDRFIIRNVLVTAMLAMVVFALILAGVELFSKIDAIVSGQVELSQVWLYLLLSLPQYLLMGASLALLFATTYFLSTLSANNERIAILNAGISKMRMARPIILLSIVLTLLGIVYQETILNPLNDRHERLSQELFGSSSTQDVRNIVLKDDAGHIIYARRYSEYSESIMNPVLIETKDGNFSRRIEASSADYRSGAWEFVNVTVFEVRDNAVTSSTAKKMRVEEFTLEPEYFKSSNISVETMEFKVALAYLAKLRAVNPESWQTKCTDFLRKVFQPMAIFVLMTVSATMNYSLKKNVLLFSIIQSLCIAVVYYVADMVFSIAAHQGAITPMMCVALPVIVTILISAVFNRLGRLL